MLLLFETSAGYSIFKVKDKERFLSTSVDDLHEEFFTSSDSAKELLSLTTFQPFSDTADAVAAITSCQEGVVGSSLKKLLQSTFKISSKKSKDKDTKKIPKEFIIADKALGNPIRDVISNMADESSKKKSETSIQIVHDSKTQELYRGIRQYFNEFLQDSETTNTLSMNDINHMQLGLSHSLSRYKLKFSSDKVDTMIVQAVGLLDELDKEINTYAMRVKEWYGWHFPELQALCADNIQYSTLVSKVGYRTNYQMYTNLSTVLAGNNAAADDTTTEGMASAIQEAAEISMGTDITDHDLINIQTLANNVISMTEYRVQLYEYLRNRMVAIAPNLTILVGELVGARLISHAGSLLNLAKQPASTIQILGAEKALFRALKTKSNTPKYGLIYHASLVGQAPPKHKGKISRILAAKAALSIRVDALTEHVNNGDNDNDNGDDDINQVDTTIGFDGRAKVEARLRQLETGGAYTLVGSNLTAKKTARYDPVAATTSQHTTPKYNSSNDIQMKLGNDNNDSDDDDDDNDNGKSSSAKKQKKEKKDKKNKKDKKKDTDDDIDNDNDKKKRKAEVESTPPTKKAKKENNGDDNNDNDDSNGKSKSSEKKSNKKEKKSKKDKK